MSVRQVTGVLDAGRLAELESLEGWHFWFVERRRLVSDLLKDLPPESVVLDVGSGTGCIAAALAAHRHTVVTVDQTTDLIARRSGVLAIAADARRLPFRDGTFDAVLLLDVLEHTADREALAEVRRVAAEGGRMVVTVPAFPWLWSARDDVAGHRRRYTRASLRSRLREAGLRVEVLHYWQRVLFPLVVISRLAGRRSLRTRDLEERPPRLVNAVCRLALASDRWLGSRLGWLPGSSIVAVCKVPHHV